MRYFGKIYIVVGLWCGIELFESEGKYDGEVEGVRYFICWFGYGIFVLVDKVFKIEFVLYDLYSDVIEEEIDVLIEDVFE